MAIAVVHRPLAGFALALVALGAARADDTLATRTISVNARPVQEIRLGEEPNSSNLRAVVVTNGPTAGTTSLYTAVGPAESWTNPAVPQPVFTPVIASGTVFSVGGGCRRGNQTDFPFINANRPQILRVQGGSATVVTPGITGNEQFDSAECTVSPDLLQTWYIYSNRSTSRLFLFVDQGGPLDLVNPLVTFMMKTPFQGGLRPQIGNIFGQNRSMAFLYMEASGQTRWRQYNIATFNVDFNCLVGTQTPAPTGFTIPRGARVMGRSVFGDFDGNGQFEAGEVDTTACATALSKTPAGPVAGTGFNWSEPAAVVTPDGGLRYTVAGLVVTFDADGFLYFTAGPHAGSGGPFDACGFIGPESQNGIVSLSVEPGNLVRVVQWVRTPLSVPGSGPLLFRSGLEPPDTVTGWRCVEYELSR